MLLVQFLLSSVALLKSSCFSISTPVQVVLLLRLHRQPDLCGLLPLFLAHARLLDHLQELALSLFPLVLNHLHLLLASHSDLPLLELELLPQSGHLLSLLRTAHLKLFGERLLALSVPLLQHLNLVCMHPLGLLMLRLHELQVLLAVRFQGIELLFHDLDLYSIVTFVALRSSKFVLPFASLIVLLRAQLRKLFLVALALRRLAAAEVLDLVSEALGMLQFLRLRDLEMLPVCLLGALAHVVNLLDVCLPLGLMLLGSERQRFNMLCAEPSLSLRVLLGLRGEIFSQPLGFTLKFLNS
mmetsp:Transcript_43539/g.135462  ORF Transcript_43539/g.135462 Transcript_43539/m.135462 type:complete len:298 (+) Transcript_43539:1179-2072(+)